MNTTGMLKLSLSDIQLISFNTYNHIIQSCYGKKFKQQTKKRSNNNVIGKINYYSAAKRNQSVEKNKRNTKKSLTSAEILWKITFAM